MQDYRSLFVWQKSHKLALDTYGVSAYPKSPEAWPLRDQMLRAVISIPSNISEDGRCRARRLFRRFLFHALGSCNELEYDLLLARDLRFLPPASYSRLAGQVEEVRRMLTGLVR